MSSKISWTHEEQVLLKHLKQEKKISSWKTIASIINATNSEFSKSGKQYRDRYINYMRFDQRCPKITDWSKDEENLFFRKYFEIGAKWVQISEEMPGRSENHLKNKFYGIIRKVSRSAQKFQKNLKPKPKKIINDKFILKAIEDFRKINKNCSGPETKLFWDDKQKKQSAEELIHMIINMNEETPESEIQYLVNFLRNINNSPHKLEGQQKSESINLQLSNKSSDKIQQWEHQFQKQKSMTEITILGEGESTQRQGKVQNPMKLIDVEFDQLMSKPSHINLQQELCGILNCEYDPTIFSLPW